MAQHEPVDPLSEFDALLTNELSVTPSPEFLPRVRERIRREPARSRWSPFGVRWSLVASFAAAAVIVFAVGLSVWLRRGVSDAVTPPVPVASTNSQPKPSPEPRVPSPESRAPSLEPRVPSPEPRAPSLEPRVPSPESRAPSLEPRVPSPESRAPTFARPPSRAALRRASHATVGTPDTGYRSPEVIVDQRQRAALVSMLRLINQGQLTEASFKNTTPAPAEIGVEPVAVSPIVVVGVLPSESGRK